MKLTIKSTQQSIDQYVEGHILNFDCSYRGGTIKIDVSDLFPEITDEDLVLGAYQNYLGGGLCGAVVGASMFNFDDLTPNHKIIAERIKESAKKLLFKETSGANDDEVQDMINFEQNQALPISAY